jgi:hypothetical protein
MAQTQMDKDGNLIQRTGDSVTVVLSRENQIEKAQERKRQDRWNKYSAPKPKVRDLGTIPGDLPGSAWRDIEIMRQRSEQLEAQKPKPDPEPDYPKASRTGSERKTRKAPARKINAEAQAEVEDYVRSLKTGD